MNHSRIFSFGLVLASSAGAMAQSPNYPSPTFSSAIGNIDARALQYAGGMKCDGATNDTSALNAAIVAARATSYQGTDRRLLLPTGQCMIDPITLTSLITLAGSSGSGSTLVLRGGSAAPAVTVQTAGAAPPAGSAFASINLENLRITAQVPKSGSALAHGLALKTGAWGVQVLGRDLTIYGMPGDGINSTTFAASGMDCTNCVVFNNAANGLTANSVSDFHFYGGVFAVNGAIGVALSGASQMVFSGTNIYSNGTYNAYLFSAAGSGTGNNIFTDVMLDRGTQVGLFYDMRGLAGAAFKGGTFVLASVSSPGNYSDVLISSAANNLALFSGSFWGNAYSVDAAYSEKYAIEFQGAGNTVTIDGTNTYAGAGLSTNATAQIAWATPPTALIRTQNGIDVRDTTQFSGITLSNGTNPVGRIVGWETGNDTGVLQLSRLGATRVQLSASAGLAPSFMLDGLSIGSSTTPPVGGLLANGHLQFKGATPVLATGASNCATSPTIMGDDNVGRIVVGTGANGGKCSFTFATPFTNPPICMVANETSGARPVFPVPFSNTILTIQATSTLTAGDNLTYSCWGYQ